MISRVSKQPCSRIIHPCLQKHVTLKLKDAITATLSVNKVLESFAHTEW